MLHSRSDYLRWFHGRHQPHSSNEADTPQLRSPFAICAQRLPLPHHLIRRHPHPHPHPPLINRTTCTASSVTAPFAHYHSTSNPSLYPPWPTASSRTTHTFPQALLAANRAPRAKMATTALQPFKRYVSVFSFRIAQSRSVFCSIASTRCAVAVYQLGLSVRTVRISAATATTHSRPPRNLPVDLREAATLRVSFYYRIRNLCLLTCGLVLTRTSGNRQHRRNHAGQH